MIKIDGLGVKNFRALKNLELVTLKPINILVGRNSAGKSTFARLLPLLKQSSERAKTAPILWWGRLVDFGMFEDVYSTNSTDGHIDVTVRFNVDETIVLNRRALWRAHDAPMSTASPIDVTFRLGKDDDGRTALRELHLNVFGIDLLLTISGGVISTVRADGQTIEIPQNIKLVWTQGSLLPLIRTVNITPTQQSSVSDESLFAPRRISRFGVHAARRAVGHFVHGNTQEDRLDEIVDRLPIAPISEFLKFCQNLPSSTVTWKATIAQTTVKSGALRQLQIAVIVYKLDLLLSVLDEAAQRHLTSVSYLEPLRATAQRYYRREEISTDELDPKGLNTPFFVQGLTPRERESLQTWTSENFGFSLSVKNSGGHLSLNIQSSDEGTPSRNMADVGLGYSQLVPVAVQLWAAARRSQNAVRRVAAGGRPVHEHLSPTVVVEQPELHLHPAYQARLADVFAVAVAPVQQPDGRVKSSPLTIIAETHSPNLISRLGELINSGKLPAEQVQILVFEDSRESSGGASVRVAKFDSKGVLSNWPIGFFDA
ncbi:MAG: DUF3696 domain-containing protein [Burkholderiales bacterium]|nr:DUF3696 domain-containing protein [Burkholderiales bacterium]